MFTLITELLGRYSEKLLKSVRVPISKFTLGFIFKISLNEWISLILVVGLVFICELVNTSLEALADFASKEKHPQIKKVKDLAAASVLISAFVALLVGIIIFCPKIIEACTHN